MKPYRSITFTALATLIVFSLSVYFSCTKDKCPGCSINGTCKNGQCVCKAGFIGTNCELVDSCYNVTCLNGGTCSGGMCVCPDGYEGSDCGIVIRDKYLGVWSVNETGTQTTTNNFTVSVEADTLGIRSVVINNFYNVYPIPVTATVTHDSIFIPMQVMPVFADTVIGWGVFHVDSTTSTITLHFKVNKSSGVDDFGYDSGSPAVFTK